MNEWVSGRSQPGESITMEYGELTEGIIGCAYRAYNKLGFGYLESVYHKCMLIELRKGGLEAASQQPIVVRYDDEVVGEFVADIVVEDMIIVDSSQCAGLYCPMRFS